MSAISPFDILLGYRLGSRQATVELQRTDIPVIHVDFKVMKLVDDLRSSTNQPRSVILTGTAGDGKTYIAYRIIEALNLNKDDVREAQKNRGYSKDGIFIDLDLSAGRMDEARLHQLHHVLAKPDRLSLICVNEGKLADVEEKLANMDLGIPPNVLRINLSQRSLVNELAWEKILRGVLDAELWQTDSNSLLDHNRNWLRNDTVAENLRNYLLLPYFLGEPITIREMLSFLAYIIGGGLSSQQAAEQLPEDRLKFLLFNTIFCEPEGYVHGGRAVPNEKLLWWLYRFDPADQTSPKTDLSLLVGLDKLEIQPPVELLEMWHRDLVVRDDEKNDVEYRERLDRFMWYARRWYALVSPNGFEAYFPFRYFTKYLRALSSSTEELDNQVDSLIGGLNRLLSNNQVDTNDELKLFYLIADGNRQRSSIFLDRTNLYCDNFQLITDLDIEETSQSMDYLERLPRRLYLQYKPQPEIRLPISLLLYETLQSASSPSGTFAATLWVKERDTVLRFMGALSKFVRSSGPRSEFKILQNGETELDLIYQSSKKQISVK
jgi:hypothetical protein